MNFFNRFFQSKIAYAHCDIPCGIYDPHNAQVAAHTVIRMTGLINDLKKEDSEAGKKTFITQLSRLTHVKEEHAEQVKHEIRVIWGDYFKEEQLKDFPDLQENVFHIMKLASKAKQGQELAVAQDLLEHVQEFAEMFYKSKGLEPIRIASGYPTGGEIVSHK